MASAPLVQPPSLDSTFGAIFIGIIIATFLEGVLTLQCYIYFSNFKADRFFLRALVALVWFLDTLHLALVASMQYEYVITHYADPVFLGTATWQFDVSVVLTSIVAFFIQSYFMWRTWVLTKNFILTGTILVLAMLSLGFGLACGAETFILKDYARFVVFRWGVGAWLGASAACDLVVAGALCWTLWHSKTGFKPTDSLLDRLIVWTLNTGLLTSIVAVIDLVCFGTMNNLIHFGFNVTLAKLYANMFVATLNQRLRARSRQGTGFEFESENDNGKRSRRAFNHPIQFASNAGMNMNVHITTTKEMNSDTAATQMTPVDHLNRYKTKTGYNASDDLESQKVNIEFAEGQDGRSDHSGQKSTDF